MKSVRRFPHLHTPSHGQTSPTDLLTVASHGIVPVHEGTLGVVPPGPHMEFEERIDAEAIREANEIENLIVEYGRSVGIGREPARGGEDEFDAYEGHLAIVGLVDERLRLRGVEGEIGEQGGVNVVHTHRPVVGTCNAPQKWSVAGCSGIVDVDVLL